jgi:hypothetical protein
MRETADLRRCRIWLFLAALAVRLLMAALIREPGYMDTAYYTVQGIRLAEGAGATEPYLWNYLDNPAGMPNPAFGYWMPLPSVLAAPFWAVGHTFFAAQIPFALLSALLAALGAQIAWEITGRMRHFWAAGALLIFSAYFFPFWTLPETFAPFALFGALCLWAGGRYWESRASRWAAIAAGAATLAYLTRSDGLILVAMALGLPLLRRDGKGFLLAGLVTALCFGPWIAYNLIARGMLLPAGGAQTLWLTNYDDTFCYRCDLSLRAYLAWGWPAILQSKLDALAWNLRTLLVVIGYIFLAPLAAIGGWRLRDKPALVLAWAYLLLLFGAMTFAFSFAGPRGGFLHSAGALLPFIVTAGLVGVDRAVAWAGGKRGWNVPQAQAVFAVGFVLLAATMSAMASSPKLADWRQANTLYRQVGAWLAERDVEPCPIMVGSPPNFWYVTRMPSLMAPNEDAAATAQVARRYGACRLLLEANHPRPLADLYTSERTADWDLVTEWGPAKLYRLVRRGP